MFAVRKHAAQSIDIMRRDRIKENRKILSLSHVSNVAKKKECIKPKTAMVAIDVFVLAVAKAIGCLFISKATIIRCIEVVIVAVDTVIIGINNAARRCCVITKHARYAVENKRKMKRLLSTFIT